MLIKKRLFRKSARKHAPGQALPEYALTLALITVVCLGTLTVFGQNIQTMLRDFAASVAAASAYGTGRGG
jgi:Flp pilus assembly pilin Flp